ncbi:MAG: hypothetical protein P4M07_12575 [Xanthobacteraceae bacterium]|nr:hypothetical protein [Xanthobacteraceae bacterium]
MRLVTALTIASLTTLTAAPAFAHLECNFNPWSANCDYLSAPNIANGVACRVKRVTVLAKDANDCSHIGGKVLKPAQ